MADSHEATPEMNAGRVKLPCADCPRRTKMTNKEDCVHPWRCLIDDALRYPSAKGTVAARIIDAAWGLPGIKIAYSRDDTGPRPSIELFAALPEEKKGYNTFKISTH